MRVEFHTPYRREPGDASPERYEVAWPEGWPVPRVGEQVYTTDGTPLCVRHVCWYPSGSGADGEFQPFVYVVLQERP